MKKTIVAMLAIGLVWAASAAGTEFSADIVMEAQGMTNTGKVYFKNAQMTRNEIMGMVTIVNQDKVYQLFPNTKKYMVSGMDEIQRQNTMAGVKDIKTFFKENKMKKAGREKVAEYDCDIYEGNLKIDEEHPPIFTKIWYAPELDYPVKQESVMPAPMGKMVFRLDNIKKGRQSGGLFKIPADYTKAAGAEEAMGMQIPQMPEDMPSQEEIMKQMEEMMKHMQQQ